MEISKKIEGEHSQFRKVRRTQKSKTEKRNGKLHLEWVRRISEKKTFGEVEPSIATSPWVGGKYH